MKTTTISSRWSAVTMPACILTLAFTLSSNALWGQQFEGMFYDSNQTFAMVLMPSGQGLQGMLAFTANPNYSYPLQGRVNNGLLTGTAMINGGQVTWQAYYKGEQLYVTVNGQTHTMIKADQQQLMNPQARTPYPNNNNPSGPSYNQPNQQQPGASPGNYTRMEQQLAGSQIVSLVKTSSVLSQAYASGITYTNLCPGGYFHNAYDGGGMVQGNGGSAGFAGTDRTGGRWSVVNYQGQPSLMLQYNNGNVAYHTMSNINKGSWYVGRTKFAVQRGGAQCR